MFTRADFHWNLKKATDDYNHKVTIKDREKRIKNAIVVLNKLTPKQQEVVRMYGQSRYAEGEDNGYDNSYNEFGEPNS